MNSCNPLVEVLLATYNGAKYLREQLDSIINQSYINWSLVIRDDNSSDETTVILNEYILKDNRIRLLKDDKGNVGLVKNFEILLSASTADYVMLADQDDVWLFNKISFALNCMLRNEHSDVPVLVFSNSFITDELLNIHRLLYSKNLVPILSDFLFYNAGYQGAGMLLNRNLINISLPILEQAPVHDYHISMCALTMGEIYFCKEPLALYRRHTSATTVNLPFIKAIYSRLKKRENSLFYKNILLYVSSFIATQPSIRLKELNILKHYLEFCNSNSLFRRMQIVFIADFKLRQSKTYLIFKLLITNCFLK